MQIYSYIKSEVLARRLKAGTKLPSKRALAAQLGISTITIEGAYGQLMAEGYIYAKAKSGYYISLSKSKILKMQNVEYMESKMPKSQFTLKA